MIFFLIPVFNEEANIQKLYTNLKNAIPSNEKYYVFSDDGSSDTTIEVIKTAFANEKFIVLGDGKNYGPGNAFNVGFEWILENSKSEADKVVTIEADNTSDLKILPEMIGISDLGFDMILASPYAQGGKLERTPIHRRFLSFAVNITVRNILNLNTQSLSNFYRVFNIGLLKKIKNKYPVIITEKGFICMLEILLKAVKLEARIIEVPMVLDFNQRIGKSKMKIFKTSFAYVRFIFNKQF